VFGVEFRSGDVALDASANCSSLVAGRLVLEAREELRDRSNRSATVIRRRGGALSPLGDGGGDDVRELARIETRELERSSALATADESRSVPCWSSDE
jgi:hypothetical protein